MWSCGWDFHKPSQNLVNAFKTKDGLPMFDDYNDEIDYPINGQPTANSRTPNEYGFYTSLKEVPQRSQGETFNGSWQAFAMNDYVFRYTDVMLMRAEALIELNRLSEAEDIINAIRQRAANSILPVSVCVGNVVWKWQWRTDVISICAVGALLHKP